MSDKVVFWIVGCDDGVGSSVRMMISPWCRYDYSGACEGDDVILNCLVGDDEGDDEMVGFLVLMVMMMMALGFFVKSDDFGVIMVSSLASYSHNNNLSA